MLKALSHIALVVTNAKKTASLFEELFAVSALERIDSDGHAEMFVNLGNVWFVLAEAPSQKARSGDHIAFHVSRDFLLSTVEKLKLKNIDYILTRSDSSLYFFDYDNHTFELETTRLDAELSSIQSVA